MYILQSTDKNRNDTQNHERPLNTKTLSAKIRTVKEIAHNKENFMDMLLIGDEEEKMILKYLKASNLYALYDSEILKSICAVLKTSKNTVEIKNLATYPKFQNQGCASFLLKFIFKKYKNFNIILGTGENEKTLNFYKKRGFIEYTRIRDFFIQNYPHPIIENGVQLKDMIYLKKDLQRDKT